MTTEAARRAADALNKRRDAEGLKRVTVWLSKEARFKLDALKKAAGSKDRAADAAILAWSGPRMAGERRNFGGLNQAASTAPQSGVIEDAEPLRMPRAPIGSLAKKPKGGARP